MRVCQCDFLRALGRKKDKGNVPDIKKSGRFSKVLQAHAKEERTVKA